MAALKERMLVLQEEIAEIEARCAGWKNCQDGSYEIECSVRGLYDKYAELRKLKGEE